MTCFWKLCVATMHLPCSCGLSSSTKTEARVHRMLRRVGCHPHSESRNMTERLTDRALLHGACGHGWQQRCVEEVVTRRHEHDLVLLRHITGKRLHEADGSPSTAQNNDSGPVPLGYRDTSKFLQHTHVYKIDRQPQDKKPEMNNVRRVQPAVDMESTHSSHTRQS